MHISSIERANQPALLVRRTLSPSALLQEYKIVPIQPLQELRDGVVCEINGREIQVDNFAVQKDRGGSRM